jgi:hypothetical protein
MDVDELRWNPVIEAFRHLDKDPTPREQWDSDTTLAVYIELSKIRDKLDADLKKTKAHLSYLEDIVVEYFMEQGIQRVTRAGRTIMLTTETWPKIVKDDLLRELGDDPSKADLKTIDEVGRQRLVEALANDPTTSHLVKSAYNHKTLQSFVLNELHMDPETLEYVIPEHLAGLLSVSMRHRAKIRRSE